MCCWLSLSC
eukprot:jgi/Chrpa1/22756/Chrysochromulina_OHIO_Genome00025950-RA